MLLSSDQPFIGNLRENYENFVAKGHELIDQAFSTEQSEQYTPEAKANDPMNNYAIGLLPPPGNFFKGISTSKFRKVIEAGKETTVLAEELGFSAKEIAHLERAGALDMAVAETVDKVYASHAMLESYERFRYAKTYLEPYTGKYLPELHVRQLIHESGIRTFPRPKGIPKNFRVKLSDRGAGMVYFHPEHTHTSIRVMPGKPHSPFPHQQRAYVICRKNGKTLDKFGNVVDSASSEAHIPIKEFVFKDQL